MGTQEAFERALEALARKERTRAELTAWLAERGFGADEVDAALARLIEDGAIDDERFARRFAGDKRELIEAEVGAEDPGAQLTRAIELLERRGGPPDDEAGRARALAYLARRGYDSELAYEAVRGFERRAA